MAEAAVITAEEVEIELDNWGIPEMAGPAPVKTVNNFFKQEPRASNVLDEEEEPKADSVPAEVKEPVNLDEIFSETETPEAVAEKKKATRAKVDKSSLIEILKEEIEAKTMDAFDDYDPAKQTIDEYLAALPAKDLKELLKTNIATREEAAKQVGPMEWMGKLPAKLQDAVNYSLKGGADLEGMFTILGQVVKVNKLDPEVEADQEHIVRNYLQAKEFGTDAEIEEEITSLKDLGKLPARAVSFKPKLDQLQEALVAAKVAKQDESNRQMQEAAVAFTKNVFDAIKPGDLNGVKLTEKEQSELYHGLVKRNFQSLSGRPTNELGHLLEKNQFGPEADLKIIAEVLFLLRDRAGYIKSLGQIVKNETTETIVRKLKGTQGASGSSVDSVQQEEKGRVIQSKPGIPRDKRNMFAR